MPRDQKSQNICIITTNKSPSILQSSSSSSSSNSSIQIIDPQHGSILSTTDYGNGGGGDAGDGVSGSSATIKISSGVGVHSLQPIIFGNKYSSISASNNNEHLYIAYGNQFRSSMHQNDNDGDMYAYLLIQGGSSSSSSPKWKCKLPEYMTGNLIVSPCGYYIIGGGRSGTCYCWSTLGTCGGTSSDAGSAVDIQSTMNDGNDSGSELVSKWVAHYRSIRSIVFSDCGSYIVTGGDDGIVNVWNLMDVVSSSTSMSQRSSDSSSSLNPIQTWSEHHLPVTSMHALPSSRIVSTSKDKQVIIMELFNGQTLAKINMTSSITTVTSDMMGHRLYLGSIDGTIYCIDLNSFAIATTAESASVISNENTRNLNSGMTKNLNASIPKLESLSGSLLEETVLGMNNTNKSSSSSSSYISELRGHNRQISCLALLQDHGHSHNDSILLVSGSVDGTIRVWDIRSRCCVHTISPWSTINNSIVSGSSSDQKDSKKDDNDHVLFPCSSITVIPRDWIECSDDGGSGVFTSLSGSNGTSGGGGGRRRKRKNQLNDSFADLIQPLQRFTRKEQQIEDRSVGGGDNSGSAKDGFITVFSKSMREKRLEVFDEDESYDIDSSFHSTRGADDNKRIRLSNRDDIQPANEDDCSDTDDETVKADTCDKKNEKVEELRKEMEDLREEVARWKKVNNKLMSKLKKISSK